MSTYNAPLKDMQFVLREIVGLSEIAALPGLQDATPEVVDAVLTEAAKFAREVLDPLNRAGDEHGARFSHGKVTLPEGYADAYAKFAAAGWTSLSGDPAHGGQGLPYVVSSATQEMWNSANMAFCLAPMLTWGVLEALEQHASPEQRALYMPRLVSGEWCGTMNLTEPQAGSDLSAVRMQATREGDHYRPVSYTHLTLPTILRV